LPELNKANIRNAEYIANPDVLPAIQLAITACSKGLLKTDVHINATTEVLAQVSHRHFSWRSNNMSHYKAFDHQHLGELTKV
jgi:N-acetyl-gamma-glutamyl-phosphate reductase